MKSIFFKSYRRKSKAPILWKDITIILCIKAALIFAIWQISFKDPVEKHLNVARMQQQLVGK